MLTAGKQSSRLRDDRGATAVIFALAVIPIMAAVGAAVDGARWVAAKARTTEAVDSAVLLGARKMQLDPSNAAAALAAAKDLYVANTARRGAVKTDNSISS